MPNLTCWNTVVSFILLRFLCAAPCMAVPCFLFRQPGEIHGWLGHLVGSQKDVILSMHSVSFVRCIVVYVVCLAKILEQFCDALTKIQNLCRQRWVAGTWACRFKVWGRCWLFYAEWHCPYPKSMVESSTHVLRTVGRVWGFLMLGNCHRRVRGWISALPWAQARGVKYFHLLSWHVSMRFGANALSAQSSDGVWQWDHGLLVFTGRIFMCDSSRVAGGWFSGCSCGEL